MKDQSSNFNNAFIFLLLGVPLGNHKINLMDFFLNETFDISQKTLSNYRFILFGHLVFFQL